MVSRIPPKYRSLVLAILVIIALMLPELRPVTELILSLAAALLIAVAIGFVISLPTLIPAIRSRGQRSHAIRIAEALSLGAFAFFVTVVSLTTTLGGKDILGGITPSGEYTWSSLVLVVGLSLIPAAICVMFAWRYTRRPIGDVPMEEQ